MNVAFSLFKAAKSWERVANKNNNDRWWWVRSGAFVQTNFSRSCPEFWTCDPSNVGRALYQCTSQPSNINTIIHVCQVEQLSITAACDNPSSIVAIETENKDKHILLQIRTSLESISIQPAIIKTTTHLR